MNLKSKAIAIASFLTVLACTSMPSISGEDYAEEYDRFDDTKTAKYKPTLQKECILDKAIKGQLYACIFMDSTENSNYPMLAFLKESEGWDLLSYSSKKEAPVIITYANGVVKRRKVKANLKTDTLSGRTVSEVVVVYLNSIPDLSNVKKLELQFGSSEFSWIPDTELVKKALEFAAD